MVFSIKILLQEIQINIFSSLKAIKSIKGLLRSCPQAKFCDILKIKKILEKLIKQ